MHKCSAEIKPQLVKEGQTTFNILYLEQKFHYYPQNNYSLHPSHVTKCELDSIKPH